MWQDLVMVSLWGGFVALDTTAALQILVSRPLVSCSVVGLLLANFPTGFLLGLIFELIYLDELPVGGALFNEGNIGATIAAGVAILLERQIGRLDLVIPLAAFSGILMSKICAHVVVLLRTINTRIYSRLLEARRITPGAVTRSHLLCILLMFAAGILSTFLAVLFFLLLLPHLARLVPVALDRHLYTIVFAFLGVGCGVLLYQFYKRKRWWHLAVGLGCGIMLWALATMLGGG